MTTQFCSKLLARPLLWCISPVKAGCEPQAEHDISIHMCKDWLLCWLTWQAAWSLSVSANVCRGAETLFPGQGKHIVDPFANEKKRERGKKRRSAEVKKSFLKKWRKKPRIKRPWRLVPPAGSAQDQLERVKLNPSTWEKYTIRVTCQQNTARRTADDAAGRCSRMWTGNKCNH